LISGAIFGIAMLLIIASFVNDKSDLVNSYSYLLYMFLGACVISSIVNMKYGFFGNIKAIGILVIFFLVIYPFLKGDVNKEKARLPLYTFVITWSVFVFLSIPMYYFDIGYVVISLDASSQGFSHVYNRLWGLFSEANCAAIYSMVALLTSVALLSKEKMKHNRIFLFINIPMNFTFIVLSGSRTAKLVAIIVAVWLCICFAWKKLKSNGKKKVLQTVVLSILSVATVFSFYFTTESLLPKTKYLVQNSCIYDKMENKVHLCYDAMYLRGNIDVITGLSSQEEKEDKTLGKKKKELEAIKRTDAEKQDISNGRIDRWVDGFKIFVTTPVVGTSPRNTVPYAKEHVPETLMALHEYTIHNSYLEVIVSTGVLGAFPMFFFIMLAVLSLIKESFSHKQSDENILLIGVAIVIGVASFFHTDIFFIFRFGGVMLWLLIGAFVNEKAGVFTKKEKDLS